MVQIIIRVSILILVLLFGVQIVYSCVEEERVGVLNLRSYFKSYYHSGHGNDPFEKRWPEYNDRDKRDNCCSWDMVQCDHSTGRVISLYLDNFIEHDGRYNNMKLWLFNVTLFRPFTQLINLDLSHNGINGLMEYDGSLKISSLNNLTTLVLEGNPLQTSFVSLDALTSLRILNLFDCQLNHSESALGITHLRQLVLLDLSSNYLSSDSIQSLGICELRSLQLLYLSSNYLNNSVPSCLSNLTSLKSLHLSHNSFEGHFPFWLTNLTLLEDLDLSNNNFEGQLFLSSLSNLSMLQYLQLSRSGLEIQTEDTLWSPTFQLQYLYLADCNLNKPNGIFPSFLRHQFNLSDVDLSHNNLTGSLPPWLFANNSQLGYLDLTNNSFTGSLSFPNVTQPSLTSLDLSRNRFEGKVPDNLGFIFPNLIKLYMSNNNFEGHIPPSIAHLQFLTFLDVSMNKFSGFLPRGLFTHCYSLAKLNVSYNHLQGDIIPHYMNLTQLQSLDASSNNFNNTIKNSLMRSPNLIYMDISNNKIMDHLPSWIGNLSSLQVLLASSNSLNGHISGGVCKLNLYYLDLSHNDFIGQLPQCSNFSSLVGLYLSHNNLSGLITNSLSSWSSLREIDLSHNFLLGVLPIWIHKLTNLRVLQLGRNNLHSPIPQQICQLVNIEILDLSQNHFYGQLPTCFQNMSFGMREDSPYVAIYPQAETNSISVQSNNTLIVWADQLLQYNKELVQVVAKRHYYTYSGGDHLSMSALDLSCNNLSGVIPPQVGHLTHIKSINLSHNNLIGSIPSSFSNLEQVEGLDLSYNQLTGTIPSQLSELHSLAVFNVSFNNLSGKTLETGQFGTFDETSYLGNPGLCVSLVNKSCHQTDILILPTSKQDEEGKALSFLFEDFWWCFAGTSVIAFLTAGAVLAINPYWRRAWFDFVEYHLIWWLF